MSEKKEKPKFIENWQPRYDGPVWRPPGSSPNSTPVPLPQFQTIDLNSDKYRDTGKIHHGDLQAAIDRTIDKKAAERGTPIDQVAQPETINLKGIQDERPKEFWTPPRIGKR